MLQFFSSPPFYTRYVYLPNESDPCPSQIRENTKLYPYFKDALGTLDGTHLDCMPPAYMRMLFRNHKGAITQNCLFASSFNMRFLYALTRGGVGNGRTCIRGCTGA
jgi:hypothetical protein